MTEVRVGCSGWNYPHWRERVYPKGLPPKKWLEYNDWEGYAVKNGLRLKEFLGL